MPWFWTDQHDANLQLLGAPLRWEAVVWRGRPGDGRFTALGLDSGQGVAGVTFNNALDRRFLRQMVQAGARIDAETLADTGQSLAAIVRGMG